MKKRRKLLIAILLTIIAALIVCVIIKEIKRYKQKVIFSWKSDVISDDSDELFDCMEELNISILYQQVSKSVEDEDIEEFLLEAYERNIKVYVLAGEHEWAKAESNEGPLEVLAQIEHYNDLVPKEAEIAGVVYDVEPYLLDEWDEDSKALMQNYVKVMEDTYEEAVKKNLHMVICIPYYYDTKGFEEELEKLISDACDEIAVMNYYRKKEIEHINTEASLAKEYKKAITTIYEFKPAGEHGLTDKNTYHEKGIEKAVENYNELYKEYFWQRIKMGFHDYEEVKEVLEHE